MFILLNGFYLVTFEQSVEVAEGNYRDGPSLETVLTGVSFCVPPHAHLVQVYIFLFYNNVYFCISVYSKKSWV